MKYEKVKATSEELASKIFEYIHKTDLSGKEKDQLFMELATSFFTSAIHDDNVIGAIQNINQKALELRHVATAGYIRFLSGNTKNVVSDMTDYKGEKRDEKENS